MALSRITEAVASFTDLTIGDDLTLTDDLLLASDAALIKFGADADVIFTHVADTGLLLNAASVIQFRDSAINIGSPADGDLDINADDEIELNSTLIDINGNLDVSGTIVGASTLSATTLEATADTAAGDLAAIGYTSVEGIILTGQGSTNDVTIKNDADGTVAVIPTGTTNFGFDSGFGSAAVAYGCRAWVNFNGTSTVAIRASGNVSSITDSGTGQYIINFTNAMPDTNFSHGGMSGASGASTTSLLQESNSIARTTSSISVQSLTVAGAFIDGGQVGISVFR